MYTYNTAKNLSEILNIEFEQNPDISDQSLDQIPDDAKLTLHNSKFLSKFNPMKDPEIAALHLANKLSNGFSQSQSAVAKNRNKKYWSNPKNIELMSKRQIRKKYSKLPTYSVTDTETTKYFYSITDIARHIQEPSSTVYKYMKKGIIFKSGYLVEKVRIDSVHMFNPQNTVQYDGF